MKQPFPNIMLEPTFQIIQALYPKDEFQEQSLSPGSAKWRIHSKGSLKYIVRPDGSDASDGFHEFTALIPAEGVLPNIIVLGRKGSASYILCYNHSQEKFETKESFHELKCRKDIEAFVCSKGSCEYIVNPLTAQLLSQGYHSITRDESGLYWGEKGAIREKIILPKEEIFFANQAPLDQALQICTSSKQSVSPCLLQQDLSPGNLKLEKLTTKIFHDLTFNPSEQPEILRIKIRGAEIIINRSKNEDFVTVCCGKNVYFQSSVTAMSANQFNQNNLQKLSDSGVRANGRQIKGTINADTLTITSTITPFSLPRHLDDGLRLIGNLFLMPFQFPIQMDGLQSTEIKFTSSRCSNFRSKGDEKWENIAC